MSLIRFQPTELAWSPLERLASLREEMNRLFASQSPDRDAGLFGGWSPNMDVYDDREEFVLYCELPGMVRDKIELAFQDGTLTVGGERQPGQPADDKSTFRSERSFGKFQRSLTLPSRVDPAKITASYTDGVLRVVLPKAEEARQRQITVNVS